MPKCHEDDSYDESYLRSLSTAELEAMVDQYFMPKESYIERYHPKEEELSQINFDHDFEDVDLITQILDILVERDGRTQEERDAETRLQWERLVASNPEFFKSTDPKESNKIEQRLDTSTPVIPISAANTIGGGKTSIGTLTPSNTANASVTGAPVAKGRKRRKVAQTLAASAVAILLLGGAAVAFKPSVFGMIGQWTEETFQLGEYSTNRTVDTAHNSETQGYEGMVEALAALNIQSPLVPKQLPEGYQYGVVNLDSLPDRITVSSICTSGEKSFITTITIYEKPSENLLYDYEKTNVSVETYEAGGIDHYILSNYEQTSISWINGNCEISIIGDIAPEDARLMINSVY